MAFTEKSPNQFKRLASIARLMALTEPLIDETVLCPLTKQDTTTIPNQNLIPNDKSKITSRAFASASVTKASLPTIATTEPL